MPLSLLHRRMPRTAAALGAALCALMGPAFAAPAGPTVALPGHVPAALAQARPLGVLAPSQTVPLTLTLPLRNQAALDDTLRRLYDKNDPLYGQYLTPEQFTDRFGPTQADYDRVAAFAQAQGLTITGTSPSRTSLSVSGSAAQVSRAFGVTLNTYQSVVDGRTFYAPKTEPSVPASLAGVVSGVVGLDNATLRHPQGRLVLQVSPNPFALPGAAKYQLPLTTGSGPGGGLTPSDIKSVYNLGNVTTENNITLDGSGQTLGLFELDGYLPSDITDYEDFFGLPHVPLRNVRIDGFSGAPGGGSGEVTLDIELQIALAPQASRIIVYEAPNSSQGVVDLYTKIATDNLAKEISTSWGLNEISSGAATRNAENAAFRQMAAQGQSMFAAAGDAGAYDSGDNRLSVDDPASQPFVTGVGGTDLTIGPGVSYSSESAWADPTDLGRGPKGTGGGGGISTIWNVPTYQSGIVGSVPSLGSVTMRNVPDVSLYGDYDTGGYLITFQGGLYIANGTSAAAPLWSAFAALVNQQRVTYGLGLLGFANPQLYPIYNTASKYASDFHDVADGSTNLYYPAVTGYDNATGLGTFKGASLISDLAPLSVPTAPRPLRAADNNTTVRLAWTPVIGSPATSYNLYRGTAAGAETLYQSGLTTTSYNDTSVTVGTNYYYQVAGVNSKGIGLRTNEVIGTAEVQMPLAISNAGFENGSSRPAPWLVSTGVIDNSSSEAPHAGAWKAWLDGYGSAHTDTLALQTTIPATVNRGTLTFSMHVDTAERSRDTSYDTLQLQVRDLTGKVLGTLPVASNLDAATGFVQKTVVLDSLLGQACQLVLVGKEDSSFQTSFVVDDFSLTVQ